MPVRAPRICKCGKVIPSGMTCACVERANRERKARFDKKRPSASQRGYDHEWVKLRNQHLALRPMCQRCGAPAALVDHIEPIRDAPHRRLDGTNLQSLCTACHSSWKQAKERK